MISGFPERHRCLNLRAFLLKGPKYRESKSFSWQQNSTLIMEDHARGWAEDDEVEDDTLSEWAKSIASLLNMRILILSATMSTRCNSVFDIPDVAADVADLHDKYVVVLAGKPSNSTVFVCQTA